MSLLIATIAFGDATVLLNIVTDVIFVMYKLRLKLVVIVRCRVAVVADPSMCGRQVMVVATVTAAAVTDTQTASTRCQSAVRQRMDLCRGTQNLVRQRWRLLTAAEARQNDK